MADLGTRVVQLLEEATDYYVAVEGSDLSEHYNYYMAVFQTLKTVLEGGGSFGERLPEFFAERMRQGAAEIITEQTQV